jgi:quercetin dioxygenase-like cupin family protein
MKALSIPLVVGWLGIASSVHAADKTHTAGKPHAEFTNPGDMKWGPAPPDLPKGAEVAVLHGDPSKKGTYAIRIKMPDGYTIPPHWHSRDEQLTVVSGTLVLHLGDTMDAPAHALEPGGFHFLPAKAHHAAEAKGETVVQVNGPGPFDIHYLNPADNPRKTAGAAK